MSEGRCGPSRMVEQSAVAVLFVRADGGPAGAPAAFARLEAAIGGPRGRRFWGWFHRGEYRACVVRRDGDDPVAWGIEEGALEAGSYARARHVGTPASIHETFAALAAGRREDDARPSLEEYRREGEVYALLPVRA